MEDNENMELLVKPRLAYLGSDDIQRQVEEDQRKDSVSADHLGVDVGERANQSV